MKRIRVRRLGAMAASWAGALGLFASACPSSEAQHRADSFAPEVDQEVGATPETSASVHAMATTHEASHEEAKPRELDAVVLRVNGVALTQADYERAMLHQAAALGMPFNGLPDRLRQRLEAPAYEGLLKRELLRQAAKRDGIETTPLELQAEKERMAQSLPPGKTFAELLDRMKTTEAKFLQDLATDLAIATWMKRQASDLPAIDEQAALRLYREQTARFASNEQATARQILIAVAPDASPTTLEAARTRAAELRGRVKGKDEATFIEVAKAESEDLATRDVGGDLGVVVRQDLLPQIGDVLFALKKGEVSEPVRSVRGFHILRGGGVTQGPPLPFERVKDRIMQIAQTEARAEHERTLFSSLERGAHIQRLIVPFHESNEPVASSAGTLSPGPTGKMPHGLPMPSKENALPGIRNPHGVADGELRLRRNDTAGLRLKPPNKPAVTPALGTGAARK